MLEDSETDDETTQETPTTVVKVVKIQSSHEPDLSLLTMPTSCDEVDVDSYTHAPKECPVYESPNEDFVELMEEFSKRDNFLSYKDWMYIFFLFKSTITAAFSDKEEAATKAKTKDKVGWSIIFDSGEEEYIFSNLEKKAIIKMVKSTSDTSFFAQKDVPFESIGELLMFAQTKTKAKTQAFNRGCKLFIPIKLKSGSFLARSLPLCKTPFNIARGQFLELFDDGNDLEFITCKWIRQNAPILFEDIKGGESDEVYILPMVQKNKNKPNEFLLEVSFSLSSRNTHFFLARVPDKLKGDFDATGETKSNIDISRYKITTRSRQKELEQFSSSIELKNAVQEIEKVIEKNPLFVFWNVIARSDANVQYYAETCPENVSYLSQESYLNDVPSFACVIIEDKDARKKTVVALCKHQLDKQDQGEGEGKERMLLITSERAQWGDKYREDIQKLHKKHVRIIHKISELDKQPVSHQAVVVVVTSSDLRAFLDKCPSMIFHRIVLEDAANVAGQVFMSTLFGHRSEFVYSELILLSSTSVIKKLTDKLPIAKLEATFGLPLSPDKSGFINFIINHILYVQKPADMTPELAEVKQTGISRTRSSSSLTSVDGATIRRTKSTPFIEKKEVKRKKGAEEDRWEEEGKEEKEELLKGRKGIMRTQSGGGAKHSVSFEEDSKQESVSKPPSFLTQFIIEQVPEMFRNVKIHLIDVVDTNFAFLMRAYHQASSSQKLKYSDVWFKLCAGGSFVDACIFNQLLLPMACKPSWVKIQDKQPLFSSSLELAPSGGYCGVCHSKATHPVVIHACLHIFCKWCFETMINFVGQDCPICRKNVEPFKASVVDPKSTSLVFSEEKKEAAQLLEPLCMENGGPFVLDDKQKFIDATFTTKFMVITSNHEFVLLFDQHTMPHIEDFDKFLSAASGVHLCYIEHAQDKIFQAGKSKFPVVVNDLHPDSIHMLMPLLHQDLDLHILVCKNGIDRMLLLSMHHKLSSFEEESILAAGDADSIHFKINQVIKTIISTNEKDDVIHALCAPNDSALWRSGGKPSRIMPDIREISTDEISVNNKWIINRKTNDVHYEDHQISLDDVSNAVIARFNQQTKNDCFPISLSAALNVFLLGASLSTSGCIKCTTNTLPSFLSAATHLEQRNPWI